MSLDAALGTAHGGRGFSDIQILPITHDEGLSLTAWQLLYLGVDDPQDLISLDDLGCALALPRIAFDFKGLKGVAIAAIVVLGLQRR